jgi:hypothetical protein
MVVPSCSCVDGRGHWRWGKEGRQQDSGGGGGGSGGGGGEW